MPASPRHIRTLLVANRGEIASRIQATAQALGMRTVAVFADADAGAAHVAMATEAVHLPGNHPRDTYLRGDLILAAAQATGADAVHPGYGFLSEDADFAAAVDAAGLIWVGPPVAAMRVMAGKVEAKARMAAVGVPTLPSAVVDPGASASELAELGDTVGYPLLVKASAGGGGKGMRLVESADGLPDAVATAGREAESSFGDATVFLERFLPAPRHIEVQVVGDQHGTVIHLGDRECSIQRRHQKVVEEAPAPTVSAELRRRMTDAAVAGATELGYVGAGTFEFLVDGDEFFFLEMNTRLQVEHPVTELVTGLDLVELQLAVAAGHPLPVTQEQVAVRGHAIEARLYAEDPASDWLPSTGRLHRFDPAGGPGVRWDAGVRSGDVVTPHYDPMLAKAIGSGATRDVAAARLAAALEGSVVHGVTTNASLLTGILRDADFLAADTSTRFLDDHPELLVRPDHTARHLAAAVAHAVTTAPRTGPAAIAPIGWRNVPGPPSSRTYEVADQRFQITYRLRGNVLRAEITPTQSNRGPSGRENAAQPPQVEMGSVEVMVEVVASTGDGIEVVVDGVRRAYVVDVAGDSVHVHGPDGATTATALPRFVAPGADALQGGLVAPVPGTVVQVLVAEGDRIEAGQLVVILEAMKVEHSIRSAAGGTVTRVLVQAGQSVDAHAPLLEVEPEDEP